MNEYLESNYFKKKLYSQIKDINDIKKHYHLYLVETQFEKVKEEGFPKLTSKVEAVKKLEEEKKFRRVLLGKIKDLGELDTKGVYFTGEISKVDPFELKLDSTKNINKELLKTFY